MFKDKSKRYITIIVFIFIAAIALRLALSWVNREANDDHMSVCSIMINEGRLPVAADCLECYNPKLYYFFVVGGIKWGHLMDGTSQVRLAQMVSCFSGILTVVFCFLFLASQPLRRRVKLMAFGMVALNPRLIAINAQATNDSLAILFCTGTIYFFYRFLRKGGGLRFAAMVIFSILAALTKGTALVLFPIIVLILMLKVLTGQGTWLDKVKHRYNLYLLAYGVFFLAIVPWGGQYVRINAQHVPVFTLKYDRSYPFPDFWKETYYGRPGITSVANSYLTFRFMDMLKHPMITNGEEIIPLHRTSFWSQLYGRAHFIYFDAWPYSWQTWNPDLIDLGRVILVIALLPTGLFLWGFIREVGRWATAVARFDLGFVALSHEWMFLFFFTAYIVFLLYGTAIYRDFCFIKAIFVFPAILAAAHIFTVGLDPAYKALDKARWKLILDLGLGSLLVLYGWSVVSLILKLSRYGW